MERSSLLKSIILPVAIGGRLPCENRKPGNNILLEIVVSRASFKWPEYRFFGNLSWEQKKCANAAGREPNIVRKKVLDETIQI